MKKGLIIFVSTIAIIEFGFCCYSFGYKSNNNSSVIEDSLASNKVRNYTDRQFYKEVNFRFNEINNLLEIMRNDEDIENYTPSELSKFEYIFNEYSNKVINYTFSDEELSVLTDKQIFIATDLNSIVYLIINANNSLKIGELDGYKGNMLTLDDLIEKIFPDDLENFKNNIKNGH